MIHLRRTHRCELKPRVGVSLPLRRRERDRQSLRLASAPGSRNQQEQQEEEEEEVLLEVRSSNGTETSFRSLRGSGKSLRTSLLENDVQMYTAWNKIWACKGQGQCGSCYVRVLRGHEYLSERTRVEQVKLRGKPESWRLACQITIQETSFPEVMERKLDDCVVVVETTPRDP